MCTLYDQRLDQIWVNLNSKVSHGVITFMNNGVLEPLTLDNCLCGQYA